MRGVTGDARGGCGQLILMGTTKYFAKGTIIADSRDLATSLLVITAGQVGRRFGKPGFHSESPQGLYPSLSSLQAASRFRMRFTRSRLLRVASLPVTTAGQVGVELPMESQEADEENRKHNGRTLLYVLGRGCLPGRGPPALKAAAV